MASETSQDAKVSFLLLIFNSIQFKKREINKTKKRKI